MHILPLRAGAAGNVGAGYVSECSQKDLGEALRGEQLPRSDWSVNSGQEDVVLPLWVVQVRFQPPAHQIGCHLGWEVLSSSGFKDPVAL